MIIHPWSPRAHLLRCSDPYDLCTIETTRVIPVDLNCFVYHMECTISDLSEMVGDSTQADEFKERAMKTRHAIEVLMWNDEESTWHDLHLVPSPDPSVYTSRQRQGCYVSNFTPLWVRAYEDSDRAVRSARALCESGLFCPGM